MKPLTAMLADFVAHPEFGADIGRAREIAKTGFIDTIATTYVGRDEPVVSMVTEFARSQSGSAPEAPILFADLNMTSMQAALVNGTAAHALDFDDVSLSAHTSTVLVPAILAEGHLLGVSGAKAVDAYVVGFEVWAELFSRESDQYHLKGWHPTGVFGAIGAAAAVACLHGLSAEVARHALSIAASMSSGLVANFGTMTKPFHAGRAAAAGIEAVRLAKLGMTASGDVFEHPAGFLNAISPAGRAELSPAESPLGKTLRLPRIGLSMKQYPVCYSGHRTIDGVLALAAQAKLQPDEVGHVHVTIGAAQKSMLRNHDPVTGLEAKFSIEFAVACALIARRVSLAELTDPFVNRPDVKSAMSKVSIAINPESCPIDPAFSFADRVVITTTDGRVLDSGDIRFPNGHAMNPVSLESMRTKFMNCVEGFDPPAGRANPEDVYGKLSRLESVRSLRDLLVAAPAHHVANRISAIEQMS